MNLLKSFALFSALLLLSAPAFGAKRKADLSLFGGNYRGTVVFTDSEQQSFLGNAHVKVEVPGSGKSARMVFSGALYSSGQAFPIFNIVTFSRHKAVVVQSLLFSLTAGPTMRGTYKSTSKRITGTLPFFIDGQVVGFDRIVAKVHNQGPKRRLTINYSHDTIKIAFDVSRRLKKSER